MTARECDRCGKFLEPFEDVVVVLNTTLEDLKKRRSSEFEIVAVFHSACHDEIAIREIDPEVDDKGVVMGKTFLCGSCDRPIQRAVITCPVCFRRRTWEY